MSTALRIVHGNSGRVALLDMDCSLVRHAHPHCHVLLNLRHFACCDSRSVGLFSARVKRIMRRAQQRRSPCVRRQVRDSVHAAAGTVATGSSRIGQCSSAANIPIKIAATQTRA